MKFDEMFNESPKLTYAKEVSVKQVIADAEQFYMGGFFCGEAVVASIWKNFDLDLPRATMKAASMMGGGMGSGCVCGALNGGAAILGIFFGRENPMDPDVRTVQGLVKELHDYFKEANGKNVTCCRVLTAGFKNPIKRAEQCTGFAGLCAGKTAEILIRELGLKNLDEED